MRQDLVERARRGDREAFGQLAAGEVDRLNAIARLILRNPDLAEDAAQEALVRCWRQLPKLRDTEKFDAWLYRILMHAIADEFGRKRRYEANIRTLTMEPSTPDGARDIADRDELERGFRHLSIDHRSIIVLHHFVGLSLPAIAEAVGIPPGTAKSRYFHAMSALRAALEAEGRTVREEVPA
jgi:RNA polymerase sigma-70 factor (ECF subfamily)